MTDLELERWRLAAAVQELFGAADADLADDPYLRTAVETMARSIQKWRHDYQIKKEVALKAKLLREIGIPLIGMKK